MSADNLGSSTSIGLDQEPTTSVKSAKLLALSGDDSTDPISSVGRKASTVLLKTNEARGTSGPSRTSQANPMPATNHYERKRMSLMHPEPPNRDHTRKNKQSPGPRRNPRRTNHCPIDFNNFVMNFDRFQAPSRSRQDFRRRTLKKLASKRNRCSTPPTVSVKTRARTLFMSSIGSIYSPPSPVSSIQPRGWPADVYERHVWPDERHELPQPQTSESFAEMVHHIFHAVLDYGLLRMSGKVFHRQSDDTIHYAGSKLRKTPYDNVEPTDEPCQHPHDLNEPCDRGETCTARVDKIKDLCLKIRQLINAIIAAGMDADVNRVMRNMKRSETGVPPAEATQEEVERKEEAMSNFDLFQDDADEFRVAATTLEADSETDNLAVESLVAMLVTEASLLYCITNNVTSDELADYLVSYPVKATWI